jgi:hypothetical protein
MHGHNNRKFQRFKLYEKFSSSGPYPTELYCTMPTSQTYYKRCTVKHERP